MKEEKKKEVAVNVSSGAEKVQAVEREKKTEQGSQKSVETKTVKKTQTKPVEDKIDVKKSNAKSTDGKAEKESEKAKKRVALALKKKEEKEKKKLERKAKAEKRKAERIAKAEKRKAERKARAEKLMAEEKARIEKKKAEREEKIRERAHKKANKSQAKSRKKQSKKQSSGERRERKSYGGWLAAVVSLGVITLALSAIVTVGAMDMRRTKDGAIAGHKATAYELIGVMENVDNDLDRIRVSASPVQQSRILTDLLVQARIAEIDLEKLPIDGQTDRNLTAFINRVGAECERMLAKLRNGENLSEKDQATLQNLYEINHSVRQELDAYAGAINNQDLMQFMKNGESELGKMLEKVENATLQENKPQMDENRDVTAPPMGEENAVKIETSKAEDLCATYFSEYNIADFQCIGETVGRRYTAYNVQGYDNEGTLLFAEIDSKTGALLRFNYYKECNEDKFDIDNSKRIAETFLEKLGYDDMTAVRVRENGTDADFTFVYEDDGVVFYPDEIKVKVCRTRGVVTGFDAEKYLAHHTDREDIEVSLSLASAKAKLHKGLEVEFSRLAVVSTLRGEKPAYEFLCRYGEEEYVVYLNANSGEEIAIVNLKNLR